MVEQVMALPTMIGFAAHLEGLWLLHVSPDAEGAKRPRLGQRVKGSAQCLGSILAIQENRCEWVVSHPSQEGMGLN